jgi:cytochrome c6
MKFLLLTVGVIIASANVARAEEDSPGMKVWKAQKCEKCHGDAGKADSKLGKKKGIADMTTAEWQKKTTDEAIKKAINDGLERDLNGNKETMQSYKDKLKPAEIDALLALIRSWAPKG